MEKNCVCDDLTMTNDPKGRIGGRAYRTVVCPDEQRRRPSPLGPVAALRSTPINMLVEREVKCDSARQSPMTSKVFPVANPTGNSSTTGAQRGASQSHLDHRGHQEDSVHHTHHRGIIQDQLRGEELAFLQFEDHCEWGFDEATHGFPASSDAFIYGARRRDSQLQPRRSSASDFANRGDALRHREDQLAVLGSRWPSSPGFLQRQACDVVADEQSQPDVSTTLYYANGILYGVDRSPVTSSYSRSQVCEGRSRSFGI
jgi:hypothetical protein